MSYLPERTEDIFGHAMAMPSPRLRAAYLDEVCRDDPALRAEIESLLTAHDQAGDFLEQPGLGPTHITSRSPSRTTSAERSLEVYAEDDALGAIIGPYKLLQRIGEGGMGVVYMAEQVAPVRRRVALKILKLGMDTRRILARFEAERQALAMMEHPNIARVLDAGTSAAGRPYFVMELVRGIPITAYCDQHRLALGERLQLFCQVCRAVQHAHQKGIIHRDLKPANLLVTLQDGAPVPKIIDFGIAKATHQRLTDKTLFTAYRQFIGTPQYMSPEQASLNGLDVDARSDIYALGVLLYELLTSQTPFDAETLQSATQTDWQQLIREVDPPTPSTRLSTLGWRAQEIAQNRRTEIRVLGKTVRGDLDWIVMKALEKDRTRRYDTALALARDVERHLCHEPIHAGAPALLHRLHKFARRHRVGAIVATAAGAALLLGLIAATMGWLHAREHMQLARQAQREAQMQLARSQSLSDFLQQILASINPQQAERLMRDAIAVYDTPPLSPLEPHVRAQQFLYELLVSQPGGLQHAETLRRQLDDNARQFWGERDLRLADMRFDFAQVAYRRGQPGVAINQALDALRIYRQHGGETFDAKPLVELIRQSVHMANRGRYPHEVYKAAVPGARLVVAYAPKEAQSHLQLGIAQFRAGRFEAARHTLYEADRRDAGSPGGAPSIMAFLAMTHFALGETEEAHRILARAQTLLRDPRWAGDTDDQSVVNEARHFLATYENPLFLDHTDGCPIDT